MLVVSRAIRVIRVISVSRAIRVIRVISVSRAIRVIRTDLESSVSAGIYARD